MQFDVRRLRLTLNVTRAASIQSSTLRRKMARNASIRTVTFTRLVQLHRDLEDPAQI